MLEATTPASTSPTKQKVDTTDAIAHSRGCCVMTRTAWALAAIAKCKFDNPISGTRLGYDCHWQSAIESGSLQFSIGYADIQIDIHMYVLHRSAKDSDTVDTLGLWIPHTFRCRPTVICTAERTHCK